MRAILSLPMQMPPEGSDAEYAFVAVVMAGLLMAIVLLYFFYDRNTSDSDLHQD
jgi:hypothetical protein